MFIIPLFVAIPLLAAFALPIVAKFKREWLDYVANGVTLFLFILAILTLTPLFAGGTFVYKMGGWIPPIGINLVLDGLSSLMLFTVTLVSFAATIFSIEYMKKFTAKGKYYTLFMLMLAGMNGVVLTGDFFNMFVFLEIAAVASYALVAFGTESEELEASFKYMVMGSVASALILLGVIIMYSLTGTLNMAHVAKMVADYGLSTSKLFCAALFIMGFGLKAALVPFHAWLPDAHPSAPAPISAMLSGVLIKALGVYAIARIFINVFGLTPMISNILIALGTISMIVGALLAIGQEDLKRLLAYSSISQVGYIILGLGIGTPLAILGGLFHLFNHATFKSLLFLNSGAIESSTGTRKLEEMGGLTERLPVTSWTGIIGSLSIAGIPPLNGFWSKLIIIIGAVMAKRFFVAALATLVSVITLAYFLRVQRFAFFGALPAKLSEIKESPRLMLGSLVALSALCVIVGLSFPLVINWILDPAVKVLVNGLGYAGLVLGE